MPGRRLTRRSAGLWVSSLLLAAAAVLSACGGSGYHYVKSSEDRTFFKVPDDWELYDNDALLDASKSDLSDDELEERRETHLDHRVRRASLTGARARGEQEPEVPGRAGASCRTSRPSPPTECR